MLALLLAIATALVAALAALVLAAVLAAPRGMRAPELLRVYPDLVRLLVSLSKDSRVARPVRWRLLLALAYNAQPINLIPDFIPVSQAVSPGQGRAWRSGMFSPIRVIRSRREAPMLDA